MAAEDQSTLDFVKQNAPPRNLKEQACLTVFVALCSALLSTILHPCVHKAAARSGHTSSLSFHPYCYFRPPANLFLSISASSVGLFSASHMCTAETTKQQEREEEICDLFRTSSQDGRCVEGGAQGECGLHVCHVRVSMFACV